MAGPHYEVYIQDLTLTSPGGTDTLACSYVWNTGRQVDDQLLLQYSVNAGEDVNWDTVNGATAKTYSPSNVTPAGGGVDPTYSVELVTNHNESGTLIQKVVDSIGISRPNGVSASIQAGFSGRKQNTTQFYILVRVLGQNDGTADGNMKFSIWNPGTTNYDLKATTKVSAGSTKYHTYLMSLLQSTYIYQLMGVDAAKIKLEMYDGNGVLTSTDVETISVISPTVNAPPGNQNGSMPFDNGTITVEVQPDSQFEYGWDLNEQLMVGVDWSVDQTGDGTLNLQISWYNSATGAWELLYEDTNAPAQGSTQAGKTSSQYYNDSYQILASLAGATTIQDQQTLTPNYEYPDGTDAVETLDPS
jgi:hypothetical protein